MNVLLLESHRKEDGRIERHIKYLLNNNINVYHLHYNLFDEPLMPGPFSYCGEKGFRINFDSNLRGKFRSVHYLIYSLRHKIAQDGIKCLESLNINLNDPMIIHVHDPILLPLASNLIKRRFNNSKIVYDRHEVFENYPKFLGFNAFCSWERISSRSVSGVVVVSDHHKNSVHKIFPHAAVSTVPNFPNVNDYDQGSIDAKIVSFNQDSEINIVYIGGLDNNLDRDVDFMLKLASNILKYEKNVKFILGGNDSSLELESRLYNYSKNFKDRFQFLGVVPRKNAIEITEKAHIGFFFVKPDTDYWVKASPNKIFEYLICGVVPVMRADIDHCQDIDEFSLNFSREASEDEILRSLLELIDNPSKLREFMIRARRSSARYTWESVASRYIDLYNSIILH